jgi:hypothetical protein
MNGGLPITASNAGEVTGIDDISRPRTQLILQARTRKVSFSGNDLNAGQLARDRRASCAQFGEALRCRFQEDAIAAARFQDAVLGGADGPGAKPSRDFI